LGGFLAAAERVGIGCIRKYQVSSLGVLSNFLKKDFFWEMNSAWFEGAEFDTV